MKRTLLTCFVVSFLGMNDYVIAKPISSQEKIALDTVKKMINQDYCGKGGLYIEYEDDAPVHILNNEQAVVLYQVNKDQTNYCSKGFRDGLSDSITNLALVQIDNSRNTGKIISPDLFIKVKHKNFNQDDITGLPQWQGNQLGIWSCTHDSRGYPDGPPWEFLFSLPDMKVIKVKRKDEGCYY